mgnify:CR=1 FL=1
MRGDRLCAALSVIEEIKLRCFQFFQPVEPSGAVILQPRTAGLYSLHQTAEPDVLHVKAMRLVFLHPLCLIGIMKAFQTRKRLVKLRKHGAKRCLISCAVRLVDSDTEFCLDLQHPAQRAERPEQIAPLRQRLQCFQLFGASAELCPFAGQNSFVHHAHKRIIIQQEFIQIDTKNILFICGGAFDGIEKIVEKRIGGSALGFEADIKDKEAFTVENAMAKVVQQDITKFGIIPELVGRLPVIATLKELDENALVRILTEPKNAIVKQYKSLLSMDGVELDFTSEALTAIARKTLEKKTGARGLRSIMENLLMPIMYAVPSDKSIVSVQVTEDCVENNAAPLVEHKKRAKLDA